MRRRRREGENRKVKRWRGRGWLTCQVTKQIKDEYYCWPLAIFSLWPDNSDFSQTLARQFQFLVRHSVRTNSHS